MKTLRIILTVVFGWSVLKGLEVLLNKSSLDSSIFKHVGLEWLFYLLIIVIICCQVGGLIWFWKPYAKGFLLSLTAVLLNLVETFIGLIISLKNIEYAKQAFLTSREARGLSVSPDKLQMFDNPLVLIIPFIFMVVLAGIWLLLIIKLNNKYKNKNNLTTHSA